MVVRGRGSLAAAKNSPVTAAETRTCGRAHLPMLVVDVVEEESIVKVRMFVLEFRMNLIDPWDSSDTNLVFDFSGVTTNSIVNACIAGPCR
jgi:hypothetical protein